MYVLIINTNFKIKCGLTHKTMEKKNLYKK